MCCQPRSLSRFLGRLAEHAEQLETLAAMGAWSARELLGIPQGADVEPLDDPVIADRFFYGDVETMRALRSAYRGEQPPRPPVSP
jgi:hypothetical protein